MQHVSLFVAIAYICFSYTVTLIIFSFVSLIDKYTFILIYMTSIIGSLDIILSMFTGHFIFFYEIAVGVFCPLFYLLKRLFS